MAHPPLALNLCAILPLLAFRLLVLAEADEEEDETLALFITSMNN